MHVRFGRKPLPNGTISSETIGRWNFLSGLWSNWMPRHIQRCLASIKTRFKRLERMQFASYLGRHRVRPAADAEATHCGCGLIRSSNSLRGQQPLGFGLCSSDTRTSAIDALLVLAALIAIAASFRDIWHLRIRQFCSWGTERRAESVYRCSHPSVWRISQSRGRRARVGNRVKLPGARRWRHRQ